MIFQGLAPSFISSITDAQGRRPTYVIGFVIYIGANIGLALNNTYAGLLVLRCLQSCGSSGLVTLAQVTVTDIVTSAERGSYISITSIASIVAPSIAPIIGGVLSESLGWHWVFWFLLIMSGVYLIPLLVWFPQTARNVVGDDSIPPRGWNRSVLDVVKDRRRDKVQEGSDAVQSDVKEELKRNRSFAWPNPLATLVIFKDKEMAILLGYSAVCYACFYAISSSLTVQFHDIYGLTSTMQGLLFIPQALGTLLAAITNTIILDKNYKRHAIKHGFDPDRKKQHDLRNFPIERARIEISIPMLMANACCTIAYGWMLQFEVNIAGPIVMLVVMGYTMMTGFGALSVLNMDVNRRRAASASAASNLSRCLLGAGMTAVVNPMIESMGRGWCFTATALVQLALLPLLWVVIRYGPAWRSGRTQ